MNIKETNQIKFPSPQPTCTKHNPVKLLFQREPQYSPNFACQYQLFEKKRKS